MTKTLAKADVEARKAADAGTFCITDHGRRSFRIGSMFVEYHGNGGSTPETNISSPRTRRVNDHDDWGTDYCAGSFHKTLTGAIRYVRGWNQREERIAS